MKIHVLGVCGTFMGGVATLARDDGHDVRGSDVGVYPPMSTLLEAQGIDVLQGYRRQHLEPAPDLVVVGNALSRGNEAVEYVLNARIPFVSGPQWLGENYLAGRRVMAVAGTHGKTTTTSMLAWILDHGGADPGFLIGGVAPGFGVSARAGTGEAFVVEADEYDTAFFDKRSKFVHYRPNIAVLNNLEYDHADIFPDLAAIETQFHHLVRTIPGNGTIICNADDPVLPRVLDRGCWTPVQTFGLGTEAQWRGERRADGTTVDVYYEGRPVASFDLALRGDHNLCNALAAVAAANAAGIEPRAAGVALAAFGGVRRRLELLGDPGGVEIYDDFAHHPTAIAASVAALQTDAGQHRVVAVLEPRSNSMRAGAHSAALGPSLANADVVFVLTPKQLAWDATSLSSALPANPVIAQTVEELLSRLEQTVRAGDRVLFMSNGGFEGAPRRFLDHMRAVSEAR